MTERLSIDFMIPNDNWTVLVKGRIVYDVISRPRENPEHITVLISICRSILYTKGTKLLSAKNKDDGSRIEEGVVLVR